MALAALMPLLAVSLVPGAPLQCQLARPVVQPAASPLMQFGGMFGGGGNKGGGGGGQVSARDADFARRQEKLASRKQASTTRLCATPCSPPAVCTRVSHNRDVGGCPEGRGRGHVSAEGQQGGEGQAGRAHWSRLQARWCARQVRLQGVRSASSAPPPTADNFCSCWRRGRMAVAVRARCA
eukprot:3765357-Prymnesium_polylepis.2